MFKDFEVITIKEKKIYFHVDKDKTTNGQRFWSLLHSVIYNKNKKSFTKRPDLALLNISVSIPLLVYLKMIGVRILIRVDGLYAETPSEKYFNSLPFVKKIFFSPLFFLYKRSKIPLYGLIINFFDRNFFAFLRIILSNYVVYQSNFAEKMHRPIFFWKKFKVIVNGSKPMRGLESKYKPENGVISLATFYSTGDRANKRISELIKFFDYVNNEKSEIVFKLHIFGFDPLLASPDVAPLLKLLTDRPDIYKLYKKFSINNLPKEIFLIHNTISSYITLAYRDPCPNSVIEAMSFGIPVVATTSGGIPDIVKSAGKLLKTDDLSNGYLSSHKYNLNYPSINYIDLRNAVIEVHSKNEKYRELAIQRFNENLNIDFIASEYLSTTLSLIK